MRLAERGTGAEVLPEVFVRAVVVVTQRPHGDAELRLVAVLEQRVAGVRREPAPQIGAKHRRDHRAVPAARFPGDAAVLARG